MSQHTIVVYEDAGQTRLGLLREQDSPKKGKIPITDSRGNDKVIPSGRLVLTLPHKVSGPLPGMHEKLTSLQEAAAGEESDLATIWELTFEEDAQFELGELLELITDSPSNRELLSLYLSLTRDSVYFKRKGELWVPKPEKLVRERIAQLEHEAQLAVQRDAFEKALQQSLIEGEPFDSAVWEQQLSLLRALALEGDEYAGPSWITPLLQRVAKASGITGTPVWYPAYEVLRRVGIFTQHEDLDLLRFGTPPPHPASSAAPGLPPLDGRQELTHLTTVTIDDASTLDMDDALSAVPAGDGATVYIHIADPASVIPWGSVLDLDARKRATSLYQPDGTHHMFPKEVSCDLLSLKAGELRPALTFRATLDDTGELISWEITEAVIQVSERLTYDSAEALLESGGATELPGMLLLLERFATLLSQRRSAAGAIDFPLPEPKITIEDETPHITVIDPESRARRLVKEYMILAGTIAAQYAVTHNLPLIFSGQRPPDEPLGPVTDPISALAQLKKMKKGEKSTSPMPHFALGVEAYVQATSPLRRYADLVAHHQIKAHLKGEELPINGDELVSLMGHLEVITTAAARIERARTQYWQLVYLANHIDTQFDALLLELNEHKAGTGTLLLPHIALRTRSGFKGRLAPGDMIRVKVLSVHPRRDELRLQHVSEIP